jgi:spermidine synthase
LGLVNLICGIALAFPAWLRRLSFWSLLAAGGLLFTVFLIPELESWSRKMLWGDFDTLENRNSVYGNLTVVENEDSRTLFINSLAAFTSPDEEAAEESVHFALLQHPNPEGLLLIGAGFNGSLEQALQHQSLKRIDWVELDPEVLELGQLFFAEQYSAIQGNPLVEIHRTDGRLFLRSSSENYDVIIVNLPEPKTAQLNRFYTLEFFQEARQRLNQNGLISFHVSGAENYISDQLAAFLACLHRTLKEVFPDVMLFPGSRIHFFAATQVGVLVNDPELLIERLRSREVHTQYVREYYLPFRLMPDRMKDLEEQLISQKDTGINKDFTPVAYHFNMRLWSTHFHRGYLWLMTLADRAGFLIVLSAILATTLIVSLLNSARRGGESFRRHAAGHCTWAMGFTMLALEILLLLGFQAVYGYVYHRLS